MNTMQTPSHKANGANPDAIELAPLPVPVSFRSDMDDPVAFDAGRPCTSRAEPR